jgi:hypothetical protein
MPLICSGELVIISKLSNSFTQVRGKSLVDIHFNISVNRYSLIRLPTVLTQANHLNTMLIHLSLFRNSNVPPK